MTLIKIAQVDEFNIGEQKRILIRGREVLLFNIHNTYFAIENKCSHQGCLLHRGTVEKYCIRCPRHGSLIDIRTGEVKQTIKNGITIIKARDVCCYPVHIQGNDIFIDVTNK